MLIIVTSFIMNHHSEINRRVSLNSLMEKTEITLPIILGCGKFVNFEELGRETFIWSLYLDVHKSMNNKSPYLKDKLPPNHRPYLFSVNISNTDIL